MVSIVSGVKFSSEADRVQAHGMTFKALVKKATKALDPCFHKKVKKCLKEIWDKGMLVDKALTQQKDSKNTVAKLRSTILTNFSFPCIFDQKGRSFIVLDVNENEGVDKMNYLCLRVRTLKWYLYQEVGEKNFENWPATVKRLNNEVKVNKSLQPHPSISRILDSFVVESLKKYVILSRYYMRRSLAMYMEKYPQGLPYRSAERLSYDLICGIRHIYQQGYQHRDIKTDNLYIKRGRKRGLSLKIGDFGHVKKITEIQSEFTVAGTPTYYSPQYARISTFFYQEDNVLEKLASEKHDVWRCGLVIYKMLSGKLPMYCNEKNYSDPGEFFEKLILLTQKEIESEFDPAYFGMDTLRRVPAACKEMLRVDEDQRFSIEDSYRLISQER